MDQKGFSILELIIVALIMTAVVGVLAGIVSAVQQTYSSQQPRTETVNDATAALDMMSRLIRMAGNNPGGIAGLQGIDPGTAVGGQYKTIRIRSDWHGASMNSIPDGDTLDSFENVTFSVSNNTLLKQESPAELLPVVFLDNVEDMQFTYYDSNNVLLTNPAASLALISRVDVTLWVRSGSQPAMAFSTSTYLRRR